MIERSRSTTPRSASPEHRTVEAGAFAFVGATLLLVGLTRPTVTATDLLLALGGVVAFAIASSVEFEIGTASAIPTIPVLVAMLALLPPAFVPALAALGLTLGAVLIARQTGRREPITITLCSSFHVIGPVVLVGAVGWPGGSLDWLMLAAIVAAQLVSDVAMSWLRNCVGLGLSVRELLSMLRWTYAVDITLAPLGYLAAVQIGPNLAVFAVTLMPVALLAMLATDRRRQVDRLLLLGGAFDEAQETARRDPLTGLGNRLAWDEAIAEAARRALDTVAIVLLDVDRLKLVNDRYGHSAGDRLIRSVADVLAAERVAHTAVCRIGGDEFGIVLAGSAASSRHHVVDRILRAVGQEPPIGDVAVSVSIGSSTSLGRGVHESVSLADDELYRAKRARSARVSTPPPLIDPLRQR